jgi:hypothetical protein
MILTAKNIHEIGSATRRALGAIRLTDQPAKNPVTIPARIEVLSAAIIDVAPPAPPVLVREVPLGLAAVRVHQNRRGWFVVSRAPFFDAYTSTFLNPVNPPELPAGRRLRLRLGVTDAGPQHLPRLFELLLPRSLDPDAAASVMVPQDVELLRAPSALVAEGWSTLRVRVRNAAGAALPAALIRVFRRPRPANARPVGIGLTEWRGPSLRGEAVVPIPGLLRFAPGAGANVLDTKHDIEIEATRDTSFPDAALRTPIEDQLPDIDALIAGAGGTMVRRVSTPGPDALVMNPPHPLAIAAAESLTLDLTLP